MSCSAVEMYHAWELLANLLTGSQIGLVKTYGFGFLYTVNNYL